MIYDGIYKRYCEKGKFADSVFEEMFKEFRTAPDRLEGDFQELDILLVKYLYTVMPPEIVREINERNDRLWEECQLELNGKQIMLMCFKYRKIYNYQRQATSILDIHNLVYYGDAHMVSGSGLSRTSFIIVMTVQRSRSTAPRRAKTTCVSSATKYTSL